RQGKHSGDPLKGAGIADGHQRELAGGHPALQLLDRLQRDFRSYAGWVTDGDGKYGTRHWKSLFYDGYLGTVDGQEDGRYQDDTLEDILQIGIDACHVHTIRKDGDDQHAEHGPA